MIRNVIETGVTWKKTYLDGAFFVHLSLADQLLSLDLIAVLQELIGPLQLLPALYLLVPAVH